MYQIGYWVGYCFGLLGIVSVFVVAITFFLFPLFTLFFPDKLFNYWKKRIGQILSWGFTASEEEVKEKERTEAVEENIKETKEVKPIIFQVEGVTFAVAPRDSNLDIKILERSLREFLEQQSNQLH